MLKAINTQREARNLRFVDFQNSPLPPKKVVGAYMFSSNWSTDIVSKNFYNWFVRLYDQNFSDNREKDANKFWFIRDCVTEFKGEPMITGEGGDSRMTISIYRKMQARYRLETREELEKHGKRSGPRWFCDTVSFLKYTMIWNMTFRLPNGDMFTDTFNEMIYTALEKEFAEEIQVFLDAKIHVFFMERIINRHHPEYPEFSHCTNCLKKEHKNWDVEVFKTWYLDRSRVQFSNGQEHTFVWLYPGKPSQDGVLQNGEIECPIDFPRSIEMREEAHVEEDGFSRIAKEMDKIYSNKDWKQNAERLLDENSVPDDVQGGYFWTYLDREAIKFQELDAERPRLEKCQDDFFDVPTCFGRVHKNGVNQFQKVAQKLYAREQSPAVFREAKEMVGCFRETVQIWEQLHHSKETIRILRGQSLKDGYQSLPLLDIDDQGTSLNMDRSISRWDDVIKRWNREAERAGWKTMEKFARYIEGRSHVKEGNNARQASLESVSAPGHFHFQRF